MELSFFQVDAFADRPFTGNPAAVMPLDRWLPDEVLQAIAAENNLAETAFTIPAHGDADYELRWFTPTVEVVLCGHATLASAHVLLEEGEHIRFRTRHAGILTAERSGDSYAISLPAWKPEPKPLPEVAAALGCSAADTHWHPNRYAVLVLEDEQAVRSVDPDFPALTHLGDVLTIVTARGTTADIVSRCFAPGAGIPEDPVTGSAHAVIVPLWAERLGRDTFAAYQASPRGGRVGCRLAGDRAVLSGRCVTVIDGTFRIPREMI